MTTPPDGAAPPPTASPIEGRSGEPGPNPAPRPPESNPNSTRVILNLASIVVIMAGMRAANDLLVPLIIAVFLAVVASSPISWLRRHGVPSWIALALVLALVLAAGAGTTWVLRDSINAFSRRLPDYQSLLLQKAQWLTALVALPGLDFNPQKLLAQIDATYAMHLAATLGSLLGQATFVLITVAFLVLDIPTLQDKMRQALPAPEITIRRLTTFADNVKDYLTAKTFTSIITGMLVATWLVILDVELPLLWGIVTFALHYIPTIGAIVSGIPPILISFATQPPERAAAVAAGYITITMLIGNILEPQMFGQRLGISSFVVMLALIVWGWVLGPIGALVAVPLTMTLASALEINPHTRWIAILLGHQPSNPPAPPKGGS